jgi:bifunctional non-homologous end joining protein LigD
VNRTLLDGEVAVVLPSGVTSFQALQNRGPETALTYFAFDLPYIDGEDPRERPLTERKERLRSSRRRLVASSQRPFGSGRSW